LITVAGTSSGNAVLLIAIALGLSWVLSHAVYLFELLRWTGRLPDLAGHPSLATRGPGAVGLQPVITSSSSVGSGRFVETQRPSRFSLRFCRKFVESHPSRRTPTHYHVRVSVLLAVLSDSCWAIARVWASPGSLKPRVRSCSARIWTHPDGCGIWLSLAAVQLRDSVRRGAQARTIAA